MAFPNPVRTAKQKFESAVYGVLQKYGYPPFGGRSRYGIEQHEPPYEREVNPHWLKNSAENNALINNSIEEKVNQTFRRGFTEWRKEWEAKCPECNEEFDTLDRFKLTDEQDPEDIDLDTRRPCPECGDMTVMSRPDPEERDRAETFFQRANMRNREEELIPDDHNSVAQTFLEVCKEVAWDIQVFDDGWMIFERSYTLKPDGSVYDWTLDEVFRAPPHLMRYSVGNDGKIGGDRWVCLECRSRHPDDYTPDKHPGPCSNCENRTYEAYAYMLESLGGEPVKWYTRGEFAHGSEYRPRFLYGYSPILSVWQESRTIEQMDEWYQEAYEQRRAPRGAIVVRSSNAESVRAWNTEQMEKLNGDSQHIPTFIDDTEGKGSPLEWVPLLEDPAQMQHMQMREWFLDRISAKFGVTAVFQNASAESSGLSQSLEIVVSNRSAQRLKSVYQDVFMPAFLGQLKVEGWTRDIARIEEEDEDAQAQRIGRWLENARTALQVGADVVWTKDDQADIKPGDLEMAEGGGDAMQGALGAMMGGDQPADDQAGQTGSDGGRPREPEQTGGQPEQPNTPTTDNPFERADPMINGHQMDPGTDTVICEETGEEFTASKMSELEEDCPKCGEPLSVFAEKDNTVTSDSSGYRNASYSGDPAEVIDYMSHVLSMLEEEETGESGGEPVERARVMWEQVEFGPSLDEVREIANQPNKNWHSLRRQSDGDWIEDYDKCEAVENLYRIMEAV